MRWIIMGGVWVNVTAAAGISSGSTPKLESADGEIVFR
jgi:hypothetical protein